MKDFRDLKSRYEFQLDNKQLVLLFAGMIVILILAFILGTLFGRNLYSMKTAEGPTPAATQPAPATPVPGEAGTAAGETAPGAPASPEEKEKLALMKELEAQKLPSAGPGTPKPGAPGPPAKTGTPAPPGKPAGETPAPTKTAKAETEPSPLPPSSSGPYCIQVAASQKKEEAETLKGKLAEKKFEAYVVKAEVPGKGTFFRVRIGHYKSKAQADKALRIFKSREPGHKEAFVTK